MEGCESWPTTRASWRKRWRPSPLRQFLGKKLDGHLAADHGIVRAGHTAGGTGADDFENLVASDLHGDLSLRQVKFVSIDIVEEGVALLNGASVLL